MASSRTSRGRYERSLEDAERDAEIARYKPGHTYTEVAAHFGIPRSSAHEAYHRAIDAAVVTAGREAIAAELIELDALSVAAWAVLRAIHVHVADGRIMKDDGTPVTDHKPTLMAITQIVRIQERRARLLGLDAPVRQEVQVTNATDAAIEQLVSELAQFDPGAEAAPGSPAQS